MACGSCSFDGELTTIDQREGFGKLFLWFECPNCGHRSHVIIKG